MSEATWYLRTQDETFGPETAARLVEWAKLGRIQPGQEVSADGDVWQRVEDVPFLDLRFSIDLGDGNPRGPFHRAAAEALLASGRLPPTATLVETRAPFAAEEAETQEAEQGLELEQESQEALEKGGADAPEAEPEAAREPDAPPEPEAKAATEIATPEAESTATEPIAPEVEPTATEPTTPETESAVRVVEKVVVDETRVRELEDLLAEERRHTGELQAKLDAAQKGAAELRAQAEKSARAAQEASDREAKLQEQVRALEDELRRLPQAASEVADIQVAVYSIMTGEAEELGRILEAEKREFEAFKQRHLERADHLLERRREMLKRAGANIEDMTRKALRDRPEDPRTAQLRKELDDLRRARELESLESAAKVRELTVQLRERKAEEARLAENMKDVTQLRAEVEALREQLQTREKELVAERQHTEDIRRQQATRQQVLMNRLATLESPSIGTAQSMETNQSREAKLVRLPSWMRLGK